MEFDLDRGDLSLEMLLKLQDGGKFKASSTGPEIITIYNQEKNLGYKNMYYPDLFITNLNEVLNKVEKSVRLRSKSTCVKIVYEKTNPFAAAGNKK